MGGLPRVVFEDIHAVGVAGAVDDFDGDERAAAANSFVRVPGIPVPGIPPAPETREYRMRFWDAGEPNGDWSAVQKVMVGV